MDMPSADMNMISTAKASPASSRPAADTGGLAPAAEEVLSVRTDEHAPPRGPVNHSRQEKEEEQRNMTAEDTVGGLSASKALGERHASAKASSSCCALC